MSTLTYDRIKDSFIRQLESLGLVSLDPGRHKQLSEAVDAHTEAVRKFLSEEQPEVATQVPKVDPAASANDTAGWLEDIELPKHWSFRQIPTTAHGAGRAIFAHYDVATQTPLAGIAHVHLIAPDQQIVDIRFKPDEGIEALRQLINEAIEDYGKEEEPIQLTDVVPLNDAAKKNAVWKPTLKK